MIEKLSVIGLNAKSDRAKFFLNLIESFHVVLISCENLMPGKSLIVKTYPKFIQPIRLQDSLTRKHFSFLDLNRNPRKEECQALILIWQNPKNCREVV